MNDCFALLEEPRRPWLDPESLKQKFLSLSAAFHPDVFHSASAAEKAAAEKRYREINNAYTRLRDPKERLLHFIELERGQKPKDTERIDSQLADTFTQVNNICREADILAGEKDTLTSPLLKVGLFERSQEMTDRLLQLQSKINTARESVLLAIQEIDSDWPRVSDRESALSKLEKYYRLLSYFTRWNSQLQERTVKLAL
jgi:DnaJ-domain-containing protein 1